jgi:hypothetical protein
VHDTGWRVRRVTTTRLTALLGAFVLSGCVAHPVGPARTAGKYEGKAVTTAKSALSAVNTVRIAATTASRDHGFGPYLSVLISEQEEAVLGLQGTFDSIQPPDGRADDLKAELDDLLADAADHVTDVRLAVRRGELPGLAHTAAPLAEDAEKLNAFSEAHA